MIMLLFRYKYLLALLFLGTICSSCQDVVQVELEEGAKLYVIDAFVQGGYNGQVIHIRYSSPYFDTKDPEPVPNAEVNLYNLTTNEKYNLFYSGNGAYNFLTNNRDFAKPGDQFRMDVILDGVTYSALNTMPRAAKIDSIGYTSFNTDIIGNPVKPFYLCTLWVKDKVDNNPDYYWIREIGVDTAYVNVCIDGTGGIVKVADKDSLYFSPPYTLMGLRRYLPGHYCSAEVHAVSKETYYFLVQARDQINNSGLFAKTPENVKTNFVTPAGAKVKAVGWFSVSNPAKAQRQMPY